MPGHHRSRTQSLRSVLRDEVYIFSKATASPSLTSLPLPATSHAKMTATLSSSEVPSYISSRSANSLISFSRPTRIQAVTLHYLNKILDELLLLILSSAKSLATDRIKSDGILKVLGGQSGSGSGAGALLAKNAVLEAELELRSYLDGQRKEGGKMPLGLSATSRWDGTDTFPVQRAYEALRVRCQYYSTLGDLEDPSPNTPQDQNIMSTDGRPIATITPGVAIYVTALLEFVAEYILQNMGRVIERDNSDEATLGDLKKAMEEDEGTAYWWSKLSTKKEIGIKEKENQTKGGKGRVVGKPWKVPDASEYDEAAGRKKFQRQSLSFNQQGPPIPSARPGTSGTIPGSNDTRRAPSAMSSNGHESRDSSTFASNRVASSMSTSNSNQTEMTSVYSSGASADTHNLTRRASSDKGWFGKRRGSFRGSQDMGSSAGTPIIQTSKTTLTNSDVNKSVDLDDSDDFESLIVSGGTMRVSLTPNRLRAIEVTKDKEETDGEADGKRSSRKRPGTLSPLSFRDGDVTPSIMTPRSGQPSPAATSHSRMSTQQENNFDGIDEGDNPAIQPRSVSRQGSIGGSRSAKSLVKGAAPPSAYRAVEPSRTPVEKTFRDDDDEGGSNDGRSPRRSSRKEVSDMTSEVKLQPRNEMGKSNSIRDMVDMFNSTPPTTNGTFQIANSSGRESSMSQQSNDNFGSSGRKSALSSAGGKMRNLFGRKTPSSGSSAGGQTRMGSMDSTMKTNFASRRGDDSMSEASYGRNTVEPKPRANAGLAIANATGGSVALDALTMGLLEGHDRAKRRSRGMPEGMNLQEEEVAPARPSKDVSVDESFVSGDSKYGVPMTIPAHQLGSSNNVATVSQEQEESLPSSNGISPVAVRNGGSQNVVGNSVNSSGMVGIYQEPRGNLSNSELSSSNHHANNSNTRSTDPPSRKIPWSYSRQSSTGRRLSGTGGPMGIARVGSGGSSSLGHGSGTGDHAPPSAWSHGQSRDSNGDLINNGVGGTKTPTPLGNSTFSSNSPRSPLTSNRSTDTARILSHLNTKMKEASTIEECRFMVTQALAAAAAAVHSDLEPTPAGLVRSNSALSFNPRHRKADSDSAFGGNNQDEEVAFTKDSLMKRQTQRSTTLQSPAVATAASPPPPIEDSALLTTISTSRPAKHRSLMLPMAVGYNANEDWDTPLYKRQGDFAAWLLDGQESVDDFESLSDDFSSSRRANLLSSTGKSPIDHLTAPSHYSNHLLKGDDFISSQGHSPEEFDSADDRMYDSPGTTTIFPSQQQGVGGGKSAASGLHRNVSNISRRRSNVESVRSIYRDASDGSEQEALNVGAA